MTAYILYHAKSGAGAAKTVAEELAASLENSKLTDVTAITDYATFLGGLESDDKLYLCGGDGMLNHFANDTRGIELKNDVLYVAAGSGNDFARDLELEGQTPVQINELLAGLPVVEVNGQEQVFLNGVGFGIDGYCCVVDDEQRASGKKPNYTAIAILGLLFHYKPTGATVVVDGQEYRYEKAWLAPTMLGRFYGGGMLPAPDQRRTNDTVSVMLMYGAGKLRTLMQFPGIFKGEHIKHEKNAAVHSGKTVTVSFDEPRAVQIDGEVIENVKSYTVRR